MIYLTGDTHQDFRRFNTDNFPEQKHMSKDDYVIICGDFGGIWSVDPNNRFETYWLNWLEAKPFTTLFIDGNHENFDRLNAFPIEMWNGGKIHRIRPHILHLMRGQIFTLEDRTFFTFGGAASHDIEDGILDPGDPKIKEYKRLYLHHRIQKQYRIRNVSWWEAELPSSSEMEEGLSNLEQHQHKVDYILTHTPCTSILKQMDGGYGAYQANVLTDYLQKIKQTTDFHQWIFGHMHTNQMFYWDRCVCIYEQISRLL